MITKDKTSQSVEEKELFNIPLNDMRKILSLMNLRLVVFLLPTLLFLMATVFEGISIGLLVPFVQGVINQNFSALTSRSIVTTLFNVFPAAYPHKDLIVFVSIIAIIFLATVGKNVFIYIGNKIVAKIVRTACHTLRVRIFERYLSLGKIFFDRNSTGILNNILINYTDMIAMQIMQIQNLTSHIFMLIMYFFMMVYISWQLTLIVVLLMPLLYFVFQVIIKKIRKTSDFYSECRSDLSNHVFNTLSCNVLVKAYSKEADEMRKFLDTSDLVAQLEYSMDKKRNIINPIQEVFSIVIALMLISGVALYIAVTNNAHQLGKFIVFFFLMRRIMISYGVFNTVKAWIAGVVGPIREVVSVFDDKPEYMVSEGELQFPGLRDTITFNIRSFSYDNVKQHLTDISFLVKKDSITAVVGASGSGKSTLVSILMRFYDCKPGSILIDGVDILSYDLMSLRSAIALVSQEVYLFNGSLRQNILYGLRRTISDEELTDALKRSRLTEVVAGLKDGLNTQIGDRGVQLSGGERQRVSIARAILKNAPILILDEATSALDSQTEQEIQSAVDEVMKGRTTIVIAHRLSTIKNADHIVVIDKGRIAEQGTMESLLINKGMFAHFWHAQRFA